MRVVSWNIRAGGGRDRRPRQIAALGELGVDIVALQEVTLGAVEPYREGLALNGLSHSLDSFALAPSVRRLVGPRRYGQLIASRWPMTSLPPGDFNIPWRERVLSCLVDVPSIGEVQIHNTHVPPGSSNGWTKIRHLEGIYARLRKPSAVPRILVGDFNTPKVEQADGRVETWGSRDDRWDKGERQILIGLANHDLHDVFRALHGYATSDLSILMRGRPRRYDHLFASRALNPVTAAYLHPLRVTGLSDHSPLLVEFAPSARF